MKSKPVKHLMALYEKKDKNLIQRALNDWYRSDEKDYEAFAGKYQLNGELQEQGHRLENMDSWCRKTGISFTPTFFVNGHQLPEVYNVEDLKDLL
jgi:protein-disulfide isomerase